MFASPIMSFRPYRRGGGKAAHSLVLYTLQLLYRLVCCAVRVLMYEYS